MKNKIITICFILIELAIFPFAVFIYPHNCYLQYSTIVICFLYSIYKAFKKDDHLLITIALFNTLIADIFLVIFNRHIEIGMIFFIITQLIYFFLIFKNESKIKGIIHLSSLLVLFITALTLVLIIIKDSVNMIIIESTIYGSILIINMIFSFVNFKEFKTVSIGLLLFIFCDLGVAYNFMSGYMGFTIEFISNLNFNYIWLFYIPSQTLISLNE